MGTITRSFANNITTSGVLLPASLDNNSIANVTAYNASIATGNMVLLSNQTASNSASISFTTGITSTYKEYQFWFIDIHPRADSSTFQFNMSTDSGSNYNVTKTTTLFRAFNTEDNSATGLNYVTAQDQAQSTSFLDITDGTGNGADECCVGIIQLFNPSSTTYVKEFIADMNAYRSDDISMQWKIGGYGNTTSAINAVRFQMNTGNFDGTILMYGIV
jgi:hypothetical protein